jgi:RNA polymerase sigma-70 factor (ECF subfamily)
MGREDTAGFCRPRRQNPKAVQISTLNDAQLVARCRAGDHEAWRELVERFSRYVYAIVIQGFRLPQHDAEDVFQDVFARAYQHLDKLRDDEALRPWLAQLTRRLCIDKLRAGQRESVSEDDIEPGELDETLATLDDALAVRQAMDALSEDCRDILDRFFCRDESYRTIGEALGLPGGTIASRISRCLGKLREIYEGRNSAGGPSGVR